MAIVAQTLLLRVQTTLQDLTARRWKVPELCRSFNAARREIVTLRPDAGSQIVTVALGAGAKQTLSDDKQLRWLSVLRNTGGTKRIITLVDRRLLDTEEPEWQNAAGVTEILHYTFDERYPRTIHVYPPAASSGASVEAQLSVVPADIDIPADGSAISAVTGALVLPDQFEQAAYNLTLALCLEKDAEHRVNADRATMHRATALQALGVEKSETRATSPRRSATESGTRPVRTAES